MREPNVPRWDGPQRRSGKSLSRRKPVEPSSDGGHLGLILGGIAFALGLIVAVAFVFRGGDEEPKTVSNYSAADASDVDAYMVEAPAAELPVESPRESTPPPRDASRNGASAGASEARTIEAPPPESAAAKPAKKVRKAKPKAAPAEKKASGPNRYVTLVLSGTLGGAELSPDDAQTWARLSYCLREEARTPHFLVYPDGSVPMARPQSPDPNAKRRSVEPDPDADPEEPTYRLVLEVSGGAGKDVTFYNQRIGTSYNCYLACRIEKWTGEEFKVIRQLSASERATPTRDSATTGTGLMRGMYDVALQGLARQLAALPSFDR